MSDRHQSVGVEYDTIAHLNPRQIRQLYELYRGFWWTQNREFADVQLMVEQSDIVIGFCQPASRDLIAFARILTDFVYRALILDVIVAEPYRGRGLGRALMDAIIVHPQLQSLESLGLFCLPEMVPFYRKWGFTDDLPTVLMARRSGRSPSP